MATHKEYLLMAQEAALNARCDRSKCGSIVVSEGDVIGSGFNSPAWELESQRRCAVDKDEYNKKVTDKTCCVHAEQRAILDALKNNPSRVKEAHLYFVRLDEKGDIAYSGMPYCTLCSKLALDAGIATFTLWHETGIKRYDIQTYNNLSFNYRE